MMIVKTDAAGKRQIIGNFPSSTQKFTKIKSSLYSFEEPTVTTVIINTALELFDGIIKSFSVGVSYD